MWWPFKKRYQYYKVTIRGGFGGVELGPYKTEQQASEAEWPDYFKPVVPLAGETILKRRVK